MADIFKIDQRPIIKRFAVCIPLFVVGYGITLVNFDVVWRYFAWANQTLAAVVLWSIYVWLARRKRNYWVALVPAVAMTFVATVTTVLCGYLANRRVNPSIIIPEESASV